MTENTLTLLHFDVCFALKKLEEQLKEKQLKILLIESERKLFDADALSKYLSEVFIQNTFLLEDVVIKSEKIIQLNNVDLLELEKLQRENPENSEMPHEYITIEHKTIFSLTNGVGVKEFLEKGGFEMFLSQHFARKCASLINMITAAYPNLKTLVHKKSDSEKHSVDQNQTFLPKRFDELFINPALINECFGLLRETEKPCINDENGFIKNKGVFIVWFNTLEVKRMLNYSFKNDKERAETLNKNFTGLNISESLFRHENKRAKELYKSYFESEISALKH